MDEDALDLTAEEVRVLGCLMEKEVTTPDSYPLTLNSLILGCNQKTNRYPVVEYEEDTVVEATEELRSKRLVYRIDMAGSRTAKYRHNIDELLGLSRAGKALLTVLLLRGPQTLGELRTRSERMYSFATTAHIKETLEEMAEEVDVPLWEKLPRGPGQKEERFRQVLGEAAEGSDPPSGEGASSDNETDTAPSRNQRIAALESEVELLKSELSALKADFEIFKREFE